MPQDSIPSGVVDFVSSDLSTSAALHRKDEDRLESSALPLFGVFITSMRKAQVIEKRDKALPRYYKYILRVGKFVGDTFATALGPRLAMFLLS